MEVNKLMAQRLAEIRKSKELTQAEFSQILKIDRSTISGLENGVTILTERNIKLVCLAFNVNEKWFRTGEGEMYIDTPAPTPEKSKDPNEEKLLDLFKKLLPDLQKYVLEQVEKLVKATQEQWVPPQAENEDEKGEKTG